MPKVRASVGHGAFQILSSRKVERRYKGARTLFTGALVTGRDGHQVIEPRSKGESRGARRGWWWKGGDLVFTFLVFIENDWPKITNIYILSEINTYPMEGFRHFDNCQMQRRKRWAQGNITFHDRPLRNKLNQVYKKVPSWLMRQNGGPVPLDDGKFIRVAAAPVSRPAAPVIGIRRRPSFYTFLTIVPRSPQLFHPDPHARTSVTRVL